MRLVKQILRPFASFRGRLLCIVLLGIVSLALTASITAALVTGQRAAEQSIAQGLKTVETLADQSALSLLYESTANAEGPLESIMSFPDVVQAGIFHTDFTPLMATMSQKLPLTDQMKSTQLRQARLIKETNQAWHFLAPVLVEPADELFPEEPLPQVSAESQVLGYSYIVMDKTTLRDMQVNMIVNNIFIALSFAVFLSMLVNYGIDRMLQPLYKLIEVMEKNEQEQTRVYADLTGPKETIHIANVFNRMMGSLDERDRRLREHGEELESIVQLRTRELVTARDAALTASRHKSEFLANMSHELRTPLQAIIGYADITKEELEMEGRDEQTEGLNRVIRNATRLLALINSILDMAKSESGKMELKLERVNLEELLKEAADNALPVIQRNNNRFESELQATTNDLIIDREKLLQMVINLLSNAGKFTSNGSIKISSQLTKDQLLIKVTDTGIGLSKKDQRLIFEEFRQVDGSTTRDFEGTGLGLAITRRFAEQLGGKIGVISSPGTGSTFSISIQLPIEQPTKDIFPALREVNG